MSNEYSSPFPIQPDGADAKETVTREVDGEEVLDDDVDADRIDSAEADRLAAGAEDAES
ncbi:hypothetical protein OED01_07430 [Microbacterium sp. M28]|uniref:hypothetical protein n=1 Tax=Microbacterium sp. M28 TaxID=2962064 RepID=UPI0021F4A519|nr:hypothetical protein [Microbacterium sp. M28]UYO98529.1 hypothetical protein OED01_07430 [Microbacterium sp. M28]